MRVSVLVLVLFLSACGSPERVIDSSETGSGTLSSCAIVCDYTVEGVVSVRADAEVAVDGAGHSNCGSCEDLLEYHAAEFSCLNGASEGSVQRVVPFECPTEARAE